ncbi:Arb2 domain [Carpediemonas membranifera]|uniref:Arb2 domain n=1 Tax=Carpediemonas membranifera TaxID=201153 RepID=A0A8J6DYX9_9EUKA|nr:Arb2 domain [Carpediemonas membranifera]|eukprot:KAG9389711.1 Arb2 domain [Carpediemonas membranifera]
MKRQKRTNIEQKAMGNDESFAKFIRSDDRQFSFKDGKLLHHGTGEQYKWTTETEYAKISEYVSNFTIDQMCSLACTVLVSSMYTTATFSRVLILHQGTGRVTLGQWARSLIVKRSMNDGSMLPIVRWAHERGIPVIVPNPNATSHPHHHTAQYWTELIEPLDPEITVDIIAHSYGGVCMLRAAKEVPGFTDRVNRLMLTDSVHGPIPSSLAGFYQKRVTHWKCSNKPLDTPLTSSDPCTTLSAGTAEHVWSTPRATPSILKILEAK